MYEFTFKSMHMDNVVIDQLPIRFSDEGGKKLVVKSEKLAFAKVDFRCNDYKIWNAFVSQINPLASYPRGIELLLTRSEISRLTGIDVKNVHKFAVNTANRIANMQYKSSTINSANGESEIEILNPVQYAKYRNGEFYVVLSPMASDEFLALKRYSSFDIDYQHVIQCKYAMAFLDMFCMKWNWSAGKKQDLKFKVAELKHSAQLLNDKGEHIKSTYKGFSEFKRKILIPALNDLNNAGDFKISIKDIKYIRHERSISELVIPCTRSRRITPKTSEITDYLQRFEMHSISKSDITKFEMFGDILAEHVGETKEKVMNTCLDYVEAKENITNFTNYLYEVLNLGIPFLPSWANPFGPFYAGESAHVKHFVKKEIVPLAFTIAGLATREELQQIEVKGAFSDFFKFKMNNFIKDRK